MIAVKIGDRVRVTCGESVVVGTVTDAWSRGVTVLPDGYTETNCFALDGWTVEVLSPPIPDVVGTIVRDADGDAWQRDEDGWYRAGSDVIRQIAYLAHLRPTVLWTPGDAT